MHWQSITFGMTHEHVNMPLLWTVSIFTWFNMPKLCPGLSELAKATMLSVRSWTLLFVQPLQIASIDPNTLN